MTSFDAETDLKNIIIIIFFISRFISEDLMQWSAEIFKLTHKSEDLIEKPESSLNLGFKVKSCFTNPG